MIVTESWPNGEIPDTAVELDGRSMFRADRVAEDSSKSRGGGLCIYVNKLWCTDSTVTERRCSSNLEYLMIKCRPFYLPREHSAVIVTAAYIPPDANAKLAMEELSSAISKQQTAHPDGLFIVAGYRGLQSFQLEICTAKISPECLLPYKRRQNPGSCLY